MSRKNVNFGKNIDMKYEICLTPQTNALFHTLCGALLTNEALVETNIILTSHSDYWETTKYILDDSIVERINKIQIVSYFLQAGGNIKFLGRLYQSSQTYGFWKDLLDHKFISENEFDSLR